MQRGQSAKAGTSIGFGSVKQWQRNIRKAHDDKGHSFTRIPLAWAISPRSDTGTPDSARSIDRPRYSMPCFLTRELFLRTGLFGTSVDICIQHSH